LNHKPIAMFLDYRFSSNRVPFSIS